MELLPTVHEGATVRAMEKKGIRTEKGAVSYTHLSYIEYLLDILLYGTPEEKKALVAEQRKEVMKLEQRFAEVGLS